MRRCPTSTVATLAATMATAGCAGADTTRSAPAVQLPARAARLGSAPSAPVQTPTLPEESLEEDEVAPVAPEPVQQEPAQQSVIVSQSVDLDGDGQTERIEIVSASKLDPSAARADEAALPTGGCEASDDGRCEAVIRIAGVQHPYPLRAGYFGGLWVEDIDIDPTDRAKELLLRQRLEGLEEDPPFVFWVVLFVDGQIVLQRLWNGTGYDAGEASVRGDRLRISYEQCPNVVTVSYRRDRSRLVEEGRDDQKTRAPEDCAG